MCGIAGIVGPGWSADALAPTVDAMVATLGHRGPDSQGLHVVDGAGIGMRRLAIIDLGTGDQPMTGEDGRTWVVQNGEIYNHRALRAELQAAGHRFRTTSDTEVLVHGWEQWGETLLPKLDGMFAFAVWEEEHRRLVLVRDRFGIKPLHWAVVAGGVAFGSELRAIVASRQIPRNVDRVAWAQYLLYEHVPAPRTIWEGISKLEAGSLLEVVDGSVVAPRRWWRLRFEPDRGGTYERRVDEVHEAVASAVDAELVSDVPVGVLLSGGVDSSLVAAAAARQSPGLPTFTVRFDRASYDESAAAAEVASHLGADHRVVDVGGALLDRLVPEVLAQLDEPLADSSIVPTAALASLTSAHVKVALGGDGGDELWAGYPTHLAHGFARIHRRLPPWLRKGVVGPLVHRLPSSYEDLSFDFKVRRFVTGADLPVERQHVQWLGGHTAEQVRALVVPDLAAELTDDVLFEPVVRLLPHLEGMEPMDRILALDAELYLQGILTKVDRASMACSLEVRVPLLNRAVVDVASSVPFEWKLRGRQGKAILRDALRREMPAALARRPKKGFNFPVAAWLRAHPEVLDDTMSGLPDVVRAPVVARLVDEHRQGRRDHRKLLWPLVVDRAWTSAATP